MDEGRPKINHHKNRKIAITFRRQPNALQVASERTTMKEAVPNRNILVSKFRLWEDIEFSGEGQSGDKNQYNHFCGHLGFEYF